MSASVCLTLTKRSCLRCCNVSRSDTVALDVVLTELGADVLCKHLKTALCSCVCRYSLTAKLTHHGADVDDLSVTLLDHSRDNCFGYDERSVQVDVNNLTELFNFHLCHRDTFDDSCVVYKDINCSKLFLDVCNHLLNLLLIGYVADVAFCVDSLCLVILESFFQMFLVSAVKCDLCASLCISFGNGKTDSVCGTCYECYFTFQ